MQMSIGLDRLKRFVCLLLIFVLLFCFFLCPRAHAVALEAATVAYAATLVGVVLVGAGVVFKSHGDMQQVGAAMYKSWISSKNAIADKIGALASWAVEHGEAAAKGALRVGKEMYREIVDAFNAYSADGVSFIFTKDMSSEDALSNIGQTCVLYLCNDSSYVKYFIVVGDTTATAYVQNMLTGKIYAGKATSISSGGRVGFLVDRYYSAGGFFPALIYKDTTPYKYDKIDDPMHDGLFYPRYGYRVSTQPIFSGDLVYPSDDYLVKMPDLPAVDEVTGSVTWPSDAAYTKDAISVPYPTDADGVKVPDIPYDKVVDQSTGKTLDDTDTDTDNPSKPGEGSGTDTPSDTVNWPSASDLSLPELIISKFPFCIPFDVIRLIGLLDAEPKAPVFKLPLKYSTVMDEEIVLDVSQWDDVIKVVRWGELIVFVAALIYVTRNYIKW